MISDKSCFNDGFNGIIQAQKSHPTFLSLLGGLAEPCAKQILERKSSQSHDEQNKLGAGGKISRKTILAVNFFRMISNSKIFSSFKLYKSLQVGLLLFGRNFVHKDFNHHGGLTVGFQTYISREMF